MAHVTHRDVAQRRHKQRVSPLADARVTKRRGASYGISPLVTEVIEGFVRERDVGGFFNEKVKRQTLDSYGKERDSIDFFSW